MQVSGNYELLGLFWFDDQNLFFFCFSFYETVDSAPDGKTYLKNARPKQAGSLPINGKGR